MGYDFKVAVLESDPIDPGILIAPLFSVLLVEKVVKSNWK